MRVKKLTFLISAFTVLTVLAFPARTAETNNNTISTTSTTKPAPAVNKTNDGTNFSTPNQFNETGLIINGTLKNNDSVNHNSTSDNSISIISVLKSNNGAVLRAFYVIVGVMAIVVVYFAIRSCRLRKKRSKTRKYGITGKNIDLEMTPLDQEDDDDDLTVFEAPKHNKR